MADSFSVQAQEHIQKVLGQLNVASIDQLPPDVRRKLMREAREIATGNVFGVDHKKDRNGTPIEQGVGSSGNQTRASIDAYIKYNSGAPDYQETLARMEKEYAECQVRRQAERAKEEEF
jgi:hypothetical protein